jgi:hypothetical protein
MLGKRLLAASTLLLIALASAGCGGSSTTQPVGTTGAIEGYVFGRTVASKSATPTPSSRQATAPEGATALDGALVTLDPTGRQVTTSADRSGNAGFFRILGLEAGSYTVTVSHDGYVTASFTAQVRAGDTTLAGVSNGQTVLEPVGASPRRKWTVMVYMDGDGDLEEYGILNMNQMETLGSDANVNMVVQFDRGPGFDYTNGDWQDTRRYLVTKDDNQQLISSPVLQQMGEVDMGTPEALTDFITWATSRYPADRYLMVLWNHGAGWRSRAAASRGIIFDDSSNTYLTMGELNQGLAASGIHFDLIAIDCSLMGMLEVFYEIRDRCDYITASEESPPGPGYPYDTIMAKLVANPDTTTEALGRVFVDDHLARYSRDPVTQSLIQTSRLPAFCAKVNDFASTLIPLVPTNRTQLDAARVGAQTYSYYSQYRDLYDFAERIRAGFSNAGVASAADTVMAGVAGANGGPVIAEAHSPTTVDRSHGISIYIPSSTQYRTDYEDLAFVKDYPRWGELVRLVANR